MASAVTSVFEHGKLRVQSYEKTQMDASSPPKPLLIVTPSGAGSYPVILFLHGFALRNNYYRQLLEHIASHGYIVVAPQLCFAPFQSSINGDLEPAAAATNSLSSSSNNDIDSAAAVANWLPGGLESVLPSGVHANLKKLALAGHSKGGHSAFALAMQKYAQTAPHFSALLGIDPVAGREPVPGVKVQVSPQILTYHANSFDIDIPVLVVGSGLGEVRKSLMLPPCAPKGLNHADFFNECKAPCSYFVVQDYGHLDMLDDSTSGLILGTCKCGDRRSRGVMRRSIAGLVVAFLEYYMDGKWGDLQAIVADPGVAPARLDPVEEKRAVVAMSRY